MELDINVSAAAVAVATEATVNNDEGNRQNQARMEAVGEEFIPKLIFNKSQTTHHDLLLISFTKNLETSTNMKFKLRRIHQQ